MGSFQTNKSEKTKKHERERTFGEMRGNFPSILKLNHEAQFIIQTNSNENEKQQFCCASMKINVANEIPSKHG